MANKGTKRPNPNVALIKQNIGVTGDLFSGSLGLKKDGTNTATMSYSAKTIKQLVASGKSPEDAAVLRKQGVSEFAAAGWELADKLRPFIYPTKVKFNTKTGAVGMNFKPIVERIKAIKMSDEQILDYMVKHPELLEKLKSANPAPVAPLPAK